MTVQTHVQHLRGSTAENEAYTGVVGEVTYDIELKTLRAHDGATAGGVLMLNGAVLDTYAPLASPALTGTPTAPTQSPGNDTTRLATTAFVQAANTALVGSATAGMDTLGEIETAVALKAPIASPTFTGTPAAPTAAPGTDTTQVATTAFVTAANTAAFGAIGPFVNALASKATPVDADDFLLSDSAASDASKKLTWANLKAAMFAALGALVTAATGKTTPADADTFLLSDSAASDASKKLTWANLKAAIFPITTFTPSITFGGAAVGITYGAAVGEVQKIGRRVRGQVRILLTNKGSSTGAMKIIGLPDAFSSNALAGTAICTYNTGMASLPAWIGGYVVSSEIRLVAQGATAVTDLTNANFTNTSDIVVYFDYLTS